MVEYRRYVYAGPVMEFDECATIYWKGETVAPSASKAKNNLAYQYKKSHGRPASTKITLPGKLTIIDQ